MESPVVLEKPTEYHGSKSDERGFPFDEEESGAWSSLAARHPDIAARLRQRPATWARKRRPSSQDPTEDFGDNLGGFDRFPFDDIPPEFREHFPARWGRRFDEAPSSPPGPHASGPPPSAPAAASPPRAAAATQTEPAEPADPRHHLPQYGLRNTVDLGQRSAADPSVDADERAHRSVSAPPDAPNMSAPNHQEGHPQPDHQATVRHIPIFVEGRDEPVINRDKTDHGAHFAEAKPQYAPPPPQPHIDRDQYFADDGPATFHHPPNFSRAFGTPFNKGFRQGPQPFVQQKVYPQTAFARGASPQRSQSPRPQPQRSQSPRPQPQRSQSPRPQPQPQPEEPPAKHEPAPRAQPPHQPAPAPHHPHPHPAPQHQHQQPPHAPSPPPPPKPQPTANDPITQILSIQTDVLNLMSEVENFVGTKKDKRYMFLDEMLTRNLIKLDNIETEGKENIRLARREAIKCIQKCIAVLEAKADGRAAAPRPAGGDPPPGDKPENGEVEMQDTKEPEPDSNTQEMKDLAQEETEQKPEEKEVKPEEIKGEAQPQAADTRPEENRAVLVDKPEEKSEEVDQKANHKKKVTKKRDKSKDKASKDSTKGDADAEKKVESMQVDDKGDKTVSQDMEVDGAPASQ